MSDDYSYGIQVDSSKRKGSELPVNPQHKGLLAKGVQKGMASKGSGIGAMDTSVATASSAMAVPTMFQRGGKVRKTGMALVHEGERVLTKRQAKRYKSRGRSR